MFFSGSELKKVKSPLTMVPKCGTCGFYKICESPKMKVFGDGEKEILIVSEAPGEEEDKSGTQWVGNSGQHLQAMLRNVGINVKRDCWLTYALICKPPASNKTIDRAIDYCRPNLIENIKNLNPKVIIPIGGVAVKSLIGWLFPKTGEDLTSITRWAGWNIPCQTLNTWICPTYNPAYLFKEKSKVLELVYYKHLKKACSHTSRPWVQVPDYRKEVESIINDDEAVDKIMKFVKNKKPISFDYETNCLKPDNASGKIYCCSVSDGTSTIAFPWRKKQAEAMKVLLSDKTIKKSGWNIKFEHRWTEAKLGIQVRGWEWDGMVNSHLIDVRDGINSLKFQAFVRLGQPVYNDDVDEYLKAEGRNGGYALNRVNEVGWDKLLLYCGMDSLLEHKMMEIQKELLK